jgi:hypothetical protein
MLNVTMLIVVILKCCHFAEYNDAEFRYEKCCYGECCKAECQCAVRHGTLFPCISSLKGKIWRNNINSNVISLLKGC